MCLPPVRADVGFMKWPSGEHRMRAQEGPAAADARTGTRFFAGCGRLRAGPVIGAWSPQTFKVLNPRWNCPAPARHPASALDQLAGSVPSVRLYQSLTSPSRPGEVNPYSNNG